MDGAKASVLSPGEWSIEQALSANVLVLLLSKRHGGTAPLTVEQLPKGVDRRRLQNLIASIPGWGQVRDPHLFSFTQWEVLAAMAAGKPVLVFTPNLASPDSDLRTLKEPGDEEEWLLKRQELFVNWVSSRMTGDLFESRADLVSKVKLALERLRKRGRFWQYLGALGLILVAILTGVFYQRHLQVEQQKARVLLGLSISLMGQDSTDAASAVFDMALARLDYPDGTEEGWRQDYAAYRSQIGSAPEKARAIQGEFMNRVAKKSALLSADRPGDQIKFGYDSGVCILALRNWDHPGRRREDLLVQHWASLQDGLDAVSFLPGALREKFRALNLPAQREEAQAALRELNRQFPQS